MICAPQVISEGNLQTMRAIVSACLTTVLSLGIAMGCKSKSTGAADLHPPPGEKWISKSQLNGANIQVEEVAERDVAVTMVTHLTFHEAHVTHVFTPVTGRVVNIEAELGQHVKKGDALVAIQSPDIEQTSDHCVNAESKVDAVQLSRDSKKGLSKTPEGLEPDLEAVEDNHEKAKAELACAKQKTALLRAGTVAKVPRAYVIRSLTDGEVLMRNRSVGDAGLCLVPVRCRCESRRAGGLTSVGGIYYGWRAHLSRTPPSAVCRVWHVSRHYSRGRRHRHGISSSIRDAGCVWIRVNMSLMYS
jgi:hypothetical protein